MNILNADSERSYEVGKKVAETARYRLYLCRPAGASSDHLLQVAVDASQNGVLDRSAYVLGRLLQESDKIEADYAKVKENPKHFLNYQLCFPEVVDTFVPADQGSRRVNILRFRGVDDVQSIVPLHNLVHRDRLRVDLRTSVWIMGKLLKILTFAHDSGVVTGDLSLGNILIEPEQHYVILFNWADAQMKTGSVERSVVSSEIRSAACCVLEALGGTPEDGIPGDGSSEYLLYQQHLIDLARGGESNAFAAHKAFYSMVDSLWPRGFYHFTTYPR